MARIAAPHLVLTGNLHVDIVCFASRARHRHCGLLAAPALAAPQTKLKPSPIKHVFVIAFENHNWTQPKSDDAAPQQIYGNPAAPYINSLVTPGNPNAREVSYASAYHNVLATPSGNNPHIHPSEPNYIWAEAGSNLGVASDSDPFGRDGTNQTPTQTLSVLSDACRQELALLSGRYRSRSQDGPRIAARPMDGAAGPSGGLLRQRPQRL